jgi:hypothetical protein
MIPMKFTPKHRLVAFFILPVFVAMLACSFTSVQKIVPVTQIVMITEVVPVTQVVMATKIVPTTPIMPETSIDLQNGLVAYYPFNGNANDESGNRNDGEVVGAVLAPDRNDKPDSAFEFDGVNSYIYVKDRESLKLTMGLTIAAWVKTSQSLPFAGIIVKANPVEPTTGYTLCVDDKQKLRAYIMWSHPVDMAMVESEIKITDGKWHFIAVTYDGEFARLYIDGMLDGTDFYMRGANGNTEPLLIGWDQSTWLSHRHFEGSIDDVRLYNRALNNYELKSLMDE